MNGYPLSVVLGAEFEEPVVSADLDTGSHATFIDAKLVRAASPTWFVGRHLGDSFLWAPAGVELAISTSTGGALRRVVPLRQVRDWKSSPFVRINERRQALVGRDLLRAFSLSVVLRTDAGETEVVAAR